jgi:hypothetical protein
VRFLRRIPVIAAGLGFGAALVFVADAYEWSGERFLAAALIITAVYSLTVLAPWLIYEQLAAAARAGRRSNGHRHQAVIVRIYAAGDFVRDDPQNPIRPETLSDVFAIPAERHGRSHVASR